MEKSEEISYDASESDTTCGNQLACIGSNPSEMQLYSDKISSDISSARTVEAAITAEAKLSPDIGGSHSAECSTCFGGGARY